MSEISPEDMEILDEDLQEFFEECDSQDFLYLIIIHKGKDNRLLTNSCIRCHHDVLTELISKQQLQHKHAKES